MQKITIFLFLTILIIMNIPAFSQVLPNSNVIPNLPNINPALVTPKIDPIKMSRIPFEKNPYAKNSLILKQSALNNNHFVGLRNTLSVELGLNASLTENNAYRSYWSQSKDVPLFPRTLRWRSFPLAADCVVIQVSAFEFSNHTDWNYPSSLIAEEFKCIPARSDGWHYVDPMDFAHLEKYPVFSYKGGIFELNVQPISLGPVRPINLNIPSIPPAGENFYSNYITRIELNKTIPVKSFFDTHTYYVRVVPVQKGMLGKITPIGSPSKSAQLFYGAQPSPPVVLYDGLPTIGLKEYSHMRADHFNFYCFYQFNKDIADPWGNVVFTKGMISNVCDSSDDSFWDDFTGFFSDMWEAITSFVDYIAHVYNSIKATLTSWVATAIGCGNNKTCQDIIGSVISYGALAMGVPPEIPNSDQLLNMGADYLAESIANQTGIPASAAQIGTDALKETMTNSQKAANDSNPNFLSLAPDFQYRPTMIKVRVKRNETEIGRLHESHLSVENVEGFYKPMSVKLPKNVNRVSGEYMVPIFLEPTQNYRSWLDYHYAAIEEFKKMNIGGYVNLENQATAVYNEFYNSYKKVMNYRITICNQLTCKKVMNLRCSSEGACVMMQPNW